MVRPDDEARISGYGRRHACTVRRGTGEARQRGLGRRGSPVGLRRAARFADERHQRVYAESLRLGGTRCSGAHMAERTRRRGLRKAARLATRFWNDEIDARGFTSDMSTSGVFVVTREPLVARMHLHLEFELRSGPFLAEGVVVRVVKASTAVQSVVKPGVGIRLLGLLEEFHETRADDAGAGEMLEMDLTDTEVLVTTFVRDIKRGGLFILTDDPPKPDSTVDIRIKLPSPHSDVHARGVVIHVMDRPSGVGVQLLGIDELREQLAKVITT